MNHSLRLVLATLPLTLLARPAPAVTPRFVGMAEAGAEGSFATVADASVGGTTAVGHFTSGGNLRPMRWTPGTGMVHLTDPGIVGRAHGVSVDGSVVVGAGDINGSISAEAFRWTQAGGMAGLGDLPGGALLSYANAVSADGSVIVGFGTTAAALEAFVWDTTNGMQSLPDLLSNTFGIDLTGWLLVNALAISEDGRSIAGNGEHAANEEPWIATVPRPDEYEPVPAGPQTTSLEGGTSEPGGLEISFDSLAGGTIIAQYLRETQQVLGQGIDLAELENAGFKVPGHEMQAWDLTFVGALNPAGQIVAAFAYDETLLSSPEDELAVFHYPETGPVQICSPNAAINSCPQLAVIDDIANTVTVTVDAIPAIEVLAGPPPPVPASGTPALLSLSLLLMGAALGVLHTRRAI